MDHSEAVNRGAVELYLLGKLSQRDSGAFEAHFFECPACAQELRAGALLVENAKAVFKEDLTMSAQVGGRHEKQESVEVRFWSLLWQRPWSVGFALPALALLGFSVYQIFVVVPGLRKELAAALAPQPMASFVLPSVSRGDERGLDLPKEDRFFAIYMDPTWPGSFPEYICSVQNESGSTRFSVRVAAPPPGKPIQIHLSRNQLPPGRYSVTVRSAAKPDKPGSELNRYSLILKPN
jgi:hypothetical protein